MPACPICAKPLDTVRQREGLFYLCASCTGRALTIPQIRRVSSDRLALRILRLIKLSRRHGERACPFCAQPMLVIQTQEPALELDACRLCSVVWFDAPTYETVQGGTVETTSSLGMQATEIVAMNRLRELKEREKAREEEERKKKKRKRAQTGATPFDPQS